MNHYDHLTRLNSGYLPSFLDELVYGGYLTALVAPALILFTSLLTNTRVQIPLLVIAYLIPLIIYSYDYYRDLNKDMITNLGRTSHLQKKVHYYPIILLIYGTILGVLIWKYASNTLIILIGLMIFGGLLYSTILKKLSTKVPLFKNIYTGINWALGGAFFLPLYNSMNIDLSFLIVFAFIMLRTTINSIFFDLKDYQVDMGEKLKTLPVMLGKDSSIKVLHLLNVISFIPLITGIYLKILPLNSLSMLIFCFFSLFYLIMAKNSLSSGSWGNLSYLADLEFILWPILLIAVITLS